MSAPVSSPVVITPSPIDLASKPAGKLFDDDALLIRRELCERSLHYFIRYFWEDIDPSTFVDNWHIGEICEHLQAVTEGEITRLIINIPPRHMKSIAVSVAWPAWTWAQEKRGYLSGPQVRFMTVSYAQSLAIRDSRKSRLLIQSRRYRKFWGDRVVLTGDQNAKGRYENDRKGQRLASSVEGIATGEGGDIDIIDDPLSAKQAKYETERQNNIDWWTETMSSRLNDPVKSAFVIVMQRLHHHDLTGHLIENEEGWTHLCLPARYESDHPHVYDMDVRKNDGDLLWPTRMPEKEISKLENSMGSYVAAGQLQQRPAPREGGMFKRVWFKIVRAAPSGGQTVRGWDLAGEDKKKSAWSVGVKMKKVKGDYYVMDVVQEKGTPKQVEDMMKNTASQDGKAVIIDFPQDPGQAGVAQKRYLTQSLAGYNVRTTPETGSKVTRAEAYSAQAEAGNVYLVEAPWNRDYVEELELFPNSDFADQVDASSRAFARLTRKKIFAGAGGEVVS